MRVINNIFRTYIYFFCFAAAGQQLAFDSLSTTIPSTDDSNKVNHYLEILRNAPYNDTKLKNEISKKALDLSEQLNYPYGVAKAYEYMAQAAEIDKKMVQSLEYNYKALEIYNQNKLGYESVTVLTKIGIIYEYFSDMEAATSYAKYALKCLYKHPNPSKIKESVNYLIILLLKVNLLPETKRVIHSYRYLFDLHSARSYDATAAFYKGVSDYYKKLNEYDKAITNAKLAQTYLSKNAKVAITPTYCYIVHNLGNTYRMASKYDSAAYYLQLGLKTSRACHYPLWEALFNRELAYLYLNLGKPKEAIPYAKRYYTNSSKNNYFDDIKQSQLLLAEINMQLKDVPSTYKYLTSYVKVADSLLKIESSYILNNLIYKRGLEDAEKMNEELISENRKKDLIIKDKQVLQFGLIIVTLIIFVFSIFVIFLFVQYRMNNNQLKAKTEEIFTQNERLEKQNVMLEKFNREKNGLIGVVSHDLKAPLNRIEGLLKIIVEDKGLKSDHKMYLSVAQKELTDAKEMIKKILDTEVNAHDDTKLKVERFDIINFLDLVIDNYQILASNKLINIEKDFRTAYLEVNTDKSSLGRIIDNLLSNAIKFSDVNKKIIVTLRELDLNNIEISIKDEGPGFTEDDKKNLFKKYQKLSAQPTAGENSTGLGLHIVKMLSDEIGTTISVENAKEGGAIFNLKIPV